MKNIAHLHAVKDNGNKSVEIAEALRDLADKLEQRKEPIDFVTVIVQDPVCLAPDFYIFGKERIEKFFMAGMFQFLSNYFLTSEHLP